MHINMIPKIYYLKINDKFETTIATLLGGKDPCTPFLLLPRGIKLRGVQQKTASEL